MLPGTEASLLLFYVGFVGMIVVGCFLSVAPEAVPVLVWWAARISAGLLLIGAVLCWRCGWKRYYEESAPFAGQSAIRFLVYVCYAPFTLPFRDIQLPKWLP